MTLGVLVTVPQYIPYEYEWRLFDWRTVPSILEFRPRPVAEASVAEAVSAPGTEMVPVKSPSSRLQDPQGTLEPFFASLYALDQGDNDQQTRILHYGDSPTTGDLITADVRELLQQRFGDAGHGAYLIAKPWAWYAHRGMDVSAEGWTINPATWRKEKDGSYGLAGVSFTAERGPGRQSSFAVRATPGSG